jgi:hypothetical protein
MHTKEFIRGLLQNRKRDQMRRIAPGYAGFMQT